ncbi:nuclear transport factor 2 family protein [Roseiarcaceae bacterium H3SJ34-1]|uniref:nuclear transport factor 2 family protein n=1 Tax=Terripilifer ovatus TaxID=3032367 RepID=UPI003AB9AB5E|nr:nuclear transport factor 2 family protein [Roseiarcaceae bacterium H3SJ34-1]
MREEDAKRVGRRDILIAAAILGAAGKALAAAPSQPAEDSLEKLRIADLVQRERAARDAGQWEAMAACWHPASSVDVSWYNGDGAGFVAASRRNASSGRVSVHQLAPTVVDVVEARAVAETPCQLVSFIPVEGIDMCMTGVVRLLWRAEQLDGRWLIAGLRMIYIRDYLMPCDPGNVPAIDRKELATYRPSYRFLSYVLARSPNRPRDDLPGIDRPETVEAVRTSQTRWLSRI